MIVEGVQVRSEEPEGGHAPEAVRLVLGHVDDVQGRCEQLEEMRSRARSGMKVEVTEMTVNVSRRVRRIAAALSPMTTNISGKYWLSGDQVMIMYSNNNLCIVRDHNILA